MTLDDVQARLTAIFGDQIKVCVSYLEGGAVEYWIYSGTHTAAVKAQTREMDDALVVRLQKALIHDMHRVTKLRRSRFPVLFEGR